MTSARGFALVVAADEGRGIGHDGTLPWRIPADMAFFRKLTCEAPPGKCNAVIMGRKTFASIPPKFRPLSSRFNIVLSRAEVALPDGVAVARSFDAALSLAERDDIARVFVIGGAEIYTLALAHAACAAVFLTQVHARFPCDAFLPPFEHTFRLTRESERKHEGTLAFTFQTYERSDAARGDTTWA